MRAPTWLRRHRQQTASECCPGCGADVVVDRSTTCEVCGYALVRQTRDAVLPPEIL